MQKTVFMFLASTIISTTTFAATYQVVISNGGEMPISPSAIYVSDTELSSSTIGMTASAGFTKLCQTGNPELRLQELDADPRVSATYKTEGLLFPGMTKTVEIEVQDPRYSVIHFEGMYGKSKDVCATFAISASTLVSVAHGKDAVGQDRVVATGVFQSPRIPAELESGKACAGQASAVDCLRSLSAKSESSLPVRAFTGYLPSVIGAIEHSFGPKETQSLLIPASGALSYYLSRIGSR